MMPTTEPEGAPSVQTRFKGDRQLTRRRQRVRLSGALEETIGRCGRRASICRHENLSDRRLCKVWFEHGSAGEKATHKDLYATSAPMQTRRALLSFERSSDAGSRMPKKLAPDATIATTWPSLTHQRDYIANVRHKMLTCRNQHGSAFVRIGVTGTGQKPCYRITYSRASGQEAIYGSYWDMHDSLDNEHAVNSNWSTASMGFEAIDQLMRAKFPPKKV